MTIQSIKFHLVTETTPFVGYFVRVVVDIGSVPRRAVAKIGNVHSHGLIVPVALGASYSRKLCPFFLLSAWYVP